MTVTVEKLTNEIRTLAPEELGQFLSWLAQYEIEQMDDWDKEIEQDSRPGGRLQAVLQRVRNDISAGRTKPLDEVFGNS